MTPNRKVPCRSRDQASLPLRRPSPLCRDCLARRVESGDHIGDNINRRVVNAIAFPRDRVENVQKVLIEIQDRVRFAGSAREDRRLKLFTVSRMTSKPTPTSRTISSMLSTRNVVRISACSGGMFCTPRGRPPGPWLRAPIEVRRPASGRRPLRKADRNA